MHARKRVSTSELRRSEARRGEARDVPRETSTLLFRKTRRKIGKERQMKGKRRLTGLHRKRTKVGGRRETTKEGREEKSEKWRKKEKGREE